MGLMLSVLIVCVGVIEALSCYEHFQYGVIHYVTNVYENARRRSSLFLKYTSERLKLLPDDSVVENDEDSGEIFQSIRLKCELTNGLEKQCENSDEISDHSTSEKKAKTTLRSTERVKKLDKKEKISIVKSLLEKPRKPKVVRSVSMPELIYTEKDIELTNIINNLVVEPIEEISIEIEDANSAILAEEFEKLFDEYENSSSNAFVGSFLNDLKEPVCQNKNKLIHLQKAEMGESKVYDIVRESLNAENFENFRKDVEPDLIKKRELELCSTKTTKGNPTFFEEFINKKDLLQENEKNYKIGRSTSVDFVKTPSIRFNKSLSEDLDISSYFNKKNNVSSESDSGLEKSLIADGSISYNKLDDTIFEYDTPSHEVIDTTFEEIYNGILDESLDLTSTFEEIEKSVLSKDDDFGTNLKAKSSKNSQMSLSLRNEPNTDLSKEKILLSNATSCRQTLSNDVVVKAAEQLAELIVRDSLNINKIKSLIFRNLTNLNTFNLKEKLGFTGIGIQTIDRFKQSQLERNTTVEKALQKSKCNAPTEGAKNFNETINGEERNVSRKLLSDMCFKENHMKIFPTAEEKDLVNVGHEIDEGKIQIIDSSIVIKENSGITFTESDPLAFDYLKSGPENLDCFKDEKQKHQEKYNFPDSSCSVNAVPKIEDIEERNIGEDSKVETLKNFNKPGNREVESGTESLSNEFKESGAKILKISDYLFADAIGKTDVNWNESRDQKVEDLLKRKVKKECELVPLGLEKEFEIQSKSCVAAIDENSDLVIETTKTSTSEGETLLVLHSKGEIKSGKNKKEITFTEQRAKHDMDNKNSGRLQPVDGMEFVIKEKSKLYEKAVEAEESVECERVGTTALNLAEAEGTLSSKKSLAVDIKEVNPDFSKVNFCLENKDEYSSASEGDTEVKSADSAPEAFWLIFSGEYTKAMSKDWHSGHFSCWQCDEALTGQRYVLRDDHPYCIKCYESVFANVCEECNKIIGIDSKDLSYKDKHWHEACFLCNKCRVSLVDKQFGSKADKIYCGNCYDAQFASRCDGCGEIFRAGTKKMEYKTRQWHEKCFCCCVCKTPIGTKSFIPREQEIYCATCYEEKFATRCVKCNKIITSGGVTYKNEPWHRECFTCTNCNTSLAGQRFTSRDEKPYCADCFGELFAKRCTACSKPITGIGGTRFISFEDRHWHNDCFICASCKTSLVGRGFITDGDDIICPECAKQKLM